MATRKDGKPPRKPRSTAVRMGHAHLRALVAKRKPFAFWSAALPPRRLTLTIENLEALLHP